MAYDDKLYAIREVSEITGVKPVTLRAWQRRYSLIQPQRTDKGHRLFSQGDIDKINDIQAWLAKGVSISKVAKMLEEGENPQSADHIAVSDSSEFKDMFNALAALNRPRLEQTLATILKTYPLEIVETQFIAALINLLNQVKSPLRALQYGLLQSVLQPRLAMIIEAENRVGHKTKTLCVNLDQTGSLYAWLWATRLSDHGVMLTMLDGVEDISALLTDIVVDQYDVIALFSHGALTEQQKRVVEELLPHKDVRLTLSSTIETLLGE